MAHLRMLRHSEQPLGDKELWVTFAMFEDPGDGDLWLAEVDPGMSEDEVRELVFTHVIASGLDPDQLAEARDKFVDRGHLMVDGPYGPCAAPAVKPAGGPWGIPRRRANLKRSLMPPGS